MDQIKEEIEESTKETKQFVSDYANNVVSTNEIPFIWFCQGYGMISEMEEICKSHFHQVVTSKVCTLATKSRPDLKIAVKTGMDLIHSKEWKREKSLLHQQFFKKEDKRESFCILS